MHLLPNKQQCLHINLFGNSLDYCNSVNYEPLFYTQVYGYGGVGIILEVLTDKVNRSVAAVREVVKDNGGKMADPGSIMFKFRRARVANVKVTDVDRDQLLTIALDTGAEDIIEPSMDEYDTEADSSERFVCKVYWLFWLQRNKVC